MQTMLAAAVEETRSAVSSATGQVRIAITDTVSKYLSNAVPSMDLGLAYCRGTVL